MTDSQANGLFAGKSVSSAQILTAHGTELCVDERSLVLCSEHPSTSMHNLRLVVDQCRCQFVYSKDGCLLPLALNTDGRLAVNSLVSDATALEVVGLGGGRYGLKKNNLFLSAQS